MNFARGRREWAGAVFCRGLTGLLVIWLAGCATRPISPEERLFSLRPLYAIAAPSAEELAAFEVLARIDRTARGIEQHNGVAFRRVTIEGRSCLLFVSGSSVVNAALTTQFALDWFPITHVILLGAAGGVNPAREAGDVVVPEKWFYHTEAAFRNPLLGGGWEGLPGAVGQPNFGMIFPETVSAVRSGSPGPEPMPFFAVDRGLLAAATKIASERSTNSSSNLSPRIVTGGTGVSGSVFVANREYRSWLYQVWQAELVDLESAAVAHVCWANRVPFVSVRAVAGLAGGGPAQDLPTQPPINQAAQIVREMLKNLPN